VTRREGRAGVWIDPRGEIRNPPEGLPAAVLLQESARLGGRRPPEGEIRLDRTLPYRTWLRIGALFDVAVQTTGEVARSADLQSIGRGATAMKRKGDTEMRGSNRRSLMTRLASATFGAVLLIPFISHAETLVRNGQAYVDLSPVIPTFPPTSTDRTPARPPFCYVATSTSINFPLPDLSNENPDSQGNVIGETGSILFSEQAILGITQFVGRENFTAPVFEINSAPRRNKARVRDHVR
jgi:hypothetical protein